MRETDRPLLLLREDRPGTLLITLASNEYEPRWPEVQRAIVQSVFQGRDICCVTYDPPIWDVELGDFGRTTLVPHGTVIFALLALPGVTAAQLSRLVETTDFQLGVLFLVDLPDLQDERLTTFLLAASRGMEPADVVPDVTWIECIDNELLYLHRPDDQQHERCAAALRTQAETAGWSCEVRAAPREDMR